MRATFLAGGEAIAKGAGRRRGRSTSRRRSRSCSASPSRSRARARAARRAQGRRGVQADLDRRAERLPRPARADDLATTLIDGIAQTVGGGAVPGDDVRRGARGAAGAGPAAGRRRQRRRLAAELRAARGHAGDRRRERVGPRRHVVRQPRVRLRRRAAAEAPGAGELPVPGDEHRREGDRASRPTGSRRRRCSRSTASRSASSAPSCRTRRSSSPPARPPASSSSTRRRASRPSRSGCARSGVKVQVVVIHQGTATGREPDRQRRRRAVGRARSSASPTRSQDTTVDAMIVGHTHRISNLMRGNILVTEGINAGDELLGPPADGQGRRRRTGPAARRASPRTSASRRAPTCRRSSTTRTPRRRCCATR